MSAVALAHDLALCLAVGDYAPFAQVDGGRHHLRVVGHCPNSALSCSIARPRQTLAMGTIFSTLVGLLGAACIVRSMTDLLVVSSNFTADFALVTHSVDHGAGLLLELLVSVGGSATPGHGWALRHKFLNLAVIEGHCAHRVIVTRLHRRILKVECVLIRVD